MRRVGKYTKNSKIRSAKLTANKYVLWFRNLKAWQKVAVIVGPIAIITVIVPLITYVYFARDISNKERLMNRNNTGVVLFDKNGEVIYQTGNARHRDLVKLNDISDYTKKALLSSEDKDFYKHSGVSLTGVVAALYANIITGGKNFGGSTLTQQLAKNTLLTNQKSFLRKYQELSIAIAIERTYSKDEILEMYLNSVYYGENSFGIHDAAKTYFNKTPAELNLAESAMLIGLLPAPSAYSPISGNIEYAKQRQKTVLTRMVNNGAITEQQKQDAINTQLSYAPKVSPQDKSPAPHFVEMVMSDLYKKYDEETLTRSGFQITTSLDLNMQRELQQMVSNNMRSIRLNGGSNASAIAIDPKTGGVRAMVGSYDWNDEKFGKVNMATARRQPGSSFKPIYYAEALANGVITPSTILEDAPTNFNGYQPKNALRNYNGDVTVRKALNWSLNIPAVKVMQKLGVSKSVEAAKRMGITTLGSTSDYGLSLALGAAEAKLIDMTHVYAAFANEGDQQPIKFIEDMKSKYDERVTIDNNKPKQVISKEGAYLISNILSDNSARSGMFGSSLNIPGKKVAVKTGTTDDQRDAWTIGYTPDLAVGVWVGNNDNTPMLSGGGIQAGPIWRSAMQKFSARQSGNPFTQPSGIVERDTCYGTGRLASRSGQNTYKEVYLSTALPSVGCNVKSEEDKKETKTDEVKPKEETETTPTPRTLPRGQQSSGSNNSENDSSQNTSSGSNGSDSTNNNNGGTNSGDSSNNNSNGSGQSGSDSGNTQPAQPTVP
ncbi:MAG: PBP1A family penicillin-binding protein [Candidatus Saccharibacteria bacterium]|nr:PBP1A family penicillin-binding protein [Candidatus Saccharibacteria bacterium]